MVKNQWIRSTCSVFVSFALAFGMAFGAVPAQRAEAAETPEAGLPANLQASSAAAQLQALADDSSTGIPSEAGSYTLTYTAYKTGTTDPSSGMASFDTKIKLDVAEGGKATLTIPNTANTDMVEGVALQKEGTTEWINGEKGTGIGYVPYAFEVDDISVKYKIAFNMPAHARFTPGYSASDPDTWTNAELVFGTPTEWSGFDKLVAAGSQETLLAKGTAATHYSSAVPAEYAVPVKMMRADDITKNSMAASVLGENAAVSIDSDGKVKLHVELGSVQVGPVTGYVTDIKMYNGASTEAELVNPSATLTYEGTSNLSSADFNITDLVRQDGVYVQLTTAGMPFAQNAYIAIDYANAMTAAEAVADAAAVESAIKALPATDGLTLANAEAVTAARAAYDALGDAAKVYVSADAVAALGAAEAKISELRTAGSTVASVTLDSAQATYTGEAIVPAVTVKAQDGSTVPAANYTAAYENNVNAGTATVTVTGKDGYTGAAKTTFEIAKAANPMTLKATSKKLKANKKTKKLAKKQTFKIAYKDAPQGAVTYTVAKAAKKYVSVSKAGKVTVKKNAPKRTYKITVKAAGTDNYEASAAVAFKVTVK